MSSVFVGVSVGWTQMEMPEHENGAGRYGAAFDPLVEQADVDGVTYAFGIGKDLSTGWRVGAYARFFDGDGASSSAVSFPAATAVRFGSVLGTTYLAGPLASAEAGTQSLDVAVTDYAIAVSAGHAVFDMLRADLVLSYGETDTEYDHVADFLVGAGPTTRQNITNTTFGASTFEVAARLSAGFPLSEDVSFNLGASAGYGVRSVDLNVRQRMIFGGAVFNDTRLGEDRDLDGFIGRLDAALGYNIARSTSIALTANYAYDDMVPVYVAPVHPAAGTGSAATFATEGHSSMTYGVRLLGRF
ncbi:MAG: hypothetical protein HOP13_13045 [Alphaproteobacteria bacterium]|nr:hypothetical protein [Alphaproteobacteria bacterium]